jgi:hypothetical protein
MIKMENKGEMIRGIELISRAAIAKYHKLVDLEQ